MHAVVTWLLNTTTRPTVLQQLLAMTKLNMIYYISSTPRPPPLPQGFAYWSLPLMQAVVTWLLNTTTTILAMTRLNIISWYMLFSSVVSGDTRGHGMGESPSWRLSPHSLPQVRTQHFPSSLCQRLGLTRWEISHKHGARGTRGFVKQHRKGAYT